MVKRYLLINLLKTKAVKKMKWIVLIGLLLITNFNMLGQTTIWKELGPTFGMNMGQIHSIAFDPDFVTNGIMYTGSPFGCLYKSEDRGDHWHSITDQLPMMGIGYTNGLGVSDIAVNPLRGTSIYYATGDGQSMSNTYTDFADFCIPTVGVYKTTDGGITWVPTGLKFYYADKKHISRIIINPMDTNNLIVAANDGIYRTTDAGNTWDKVYSVPNTQPVMPIRGLEFNSENPDLVYASGNKILFSGDNGLNWTLFPTQPTDFPNNLPSNEIPLVYNISSPENGKIYAGLITIDMGSLSHPRIEHFYYYNSFDPNPRWTQEHDCPPQGQMGIVETRFPIMAAPFNSDIIIMGELLFYQSLDNGNNWTAVPTMHVDCHAIKFAPGGTNNNYTIYFGTDGGLSKINYINGIGQPLIYLNNGLSVVSMNKIGGVESKSNIILSGQQDDGNFRYDKNATPEWVDLPAGGGDGREKIIDYENTDIWYSCSLKNGLTPLLYGPNFRSVSGITGFTEIDNPKTLNLDPDLNAANDAPAIIDPINHFWVYYGYCDVWRAEFYNEIDNSLQYSQLSFPGDLRAVGENDRAVYDIAVVPYYENSILHRRYYVSNDYGGIFRSNDGGYHSWELISPIPNPRMNLTTGNKITIATNPDDKDFLCIGYSSIEDGDNEIFNNNRIWKSIDGGVNWIQYGQGLPNIPVNKIVYEKGSNDGLYAGTDLGVYYRNSTMSQWVLLTGMPSLMVKDMEINYCAQKLRIATYGRGLWEGDLISYTTIIPSTTTWSTPRNVYSNVDIPSGVTLTITADINIGRNKKIVIKPGGKLIIDGHKLSNTCNEMWQGIEVNGNEQASQLTIGAQGIVEIINGGIIENAVCGIKTVATDNNGNEIPGSYGGIIRADGAIFRNCKTGIEFLPYKNINPNNGAEMNNASYVMNSTFETTDDYYNLTTEMPEAMIKMDGIKGLKIQGNHFENSATASKTGYERGQGIVSSDATMHARLNEFEKLGRGIEIKNTNPLLSSTIDENEFIDVFRGIHAEGMRSGIIRNNSINVGGSIGQYYEGSFHKFDSYGLHLEGCTGYNVYGNNFATNDGYFGAIISNSGTEANLINNNVFSGFQVACQAEGKNGTMPFWGRSYNDNVGSQLMTNTGLVFKCNEYSGDYLSDINVVSTFNVAGLIDVEQGSCLNGFSHADNTFSGVPLNKNINASSTTVPFSYSFFNVPFWGKIPHL